MNTCVSLKNAIKENLSKANNPWTATAKNGRVY